VKKNLIYVLVLAVFLLIGSFSLTQNEESSTPKIPKIGYINFDEAMKSFAEWQRLNESYMKDYAFYQQKLRDLEEEWKKMKESGASREELQRKEQEILARKQQYEQALQAEYGRKSQEIIKKVLEKAKEFGKTLGYDILLSNQGVIYADPSYDITKEFVAFLNQGYEENK